MNEFQGEIPNDSLPKMYAPGSSRPIFDAIEEVQEKGSGLIETLQDYNIDLLCTDERHRLLESINTLSADEKLKDQTAVYVATEATKWVANKGFEHYPYRASGEKVLVEEIFERITLGYDMLRRVGYAEVPKDTEMFGLCLSLTINLKGALYAYEEWSKSNTKIDFDKKPSEMREFAAVCELRYLDIMSEKFSDEPSSLSDGQTLASRYIENFDILLGSQGSHPLFESYGDQSIEKIASWINPEDPHATDQVLWLARNSSSSELKERLLDQAVSFHNEYERQIPRKSTQQEMIDLFVITENDPADLARESLGALVVNIEVDFADIIVSHPKHIKEVMAFYSPKIQKKMWGELANTLVKVCTSMDRSSWQDLEEMSKLQSAFRTLTLDSEASTAANDEIQRWFSFHPGEN